MWNALHPIVLPALLARLVPEASKNTYLGLLTFMGMVTAMILQPISGAASDRWSSRLGRRRPLMAIGTAFDLVFLLTLGWAAGITGLVIGYVGLQISSNTAQGPLQALLRDRVPPRQLGVASSVKVFMDFASLIAASLVAGQLLGKGQPGTALVILVIIGILLITAGITIGLTHEEPTDGRTSSFGGIHRLGGFRGAGEHSSYWWLIGERAAFLLGIYGLQTFGQYYLQDALKVGDPARETGNILAIIGAATIVFVLMGGWMADRFGAKRLLFAASVLAAGGMFLMILVTSLPALYVDGLLVGAGMGLFLTANWAMASRLAPASEAGKYLGLTNLATAGAAAMARLEGPLVDVLNAARPEEWLGYKGIFAFGGACILLSIWFLSKVR